MKSTKSMSYITDLQFSNMFRAKKKVNHHIKYLKETYLLPPTGVKESITFKAAVKYMQMSSLKAYL